MIELDPASSTEKQPYMIYTADGSSPKEIDDGLFVEKLDTSTEQYGVRVCVADVSKLYSNGDARKQAMENVSAAYWDLPNDERGYDPMIDPDYIHNLQLSEGKLRNALMISFTVGRMVVPSEVSVDYGKVEVVKNLSYKEFSARSKSGGPLEMYWRVGKLINEKLGYRQGGDSSKKTNGPNERQMTNTSYSSWRQGSRLNEAFMVAANHLVGKMLSVEDLPAIYRVHDSSDVSLREVIDSDKAVYRRTPGLHKGLGLDPYCRVTSPLRRLEDFIMAHHLKLRANGKVPSATDIRVMDEAILALNKRAIYNSLASSPGVVSRNERMRAQAAEARLKLVG